MKFEDIVLDLKSAELSCNDKSVQLSHKEFNILKVFLTNPKMTFTKDILIGNVWGVESEATDNNVEVYISFLRKKLRYLDSRVTIKNIHQIGYRVEVE